MKFKKTNEFAKTLKDTDGFKGMTANWIWTAEDGMERFAMRLMEFAPGGHTSFHDHLEEHQFYFLEGEPAIIDSEGNEIRLEAGDSAFTSVNEPHQVKNVGTTTMKMICMIPILPGGDGKVTTHAPGKKKKPGC